MRSLKVQSVSRLPLYYLSSHSIYTHPMRGCGGDAAAAVVMVVMIRVVVTVVGTAVVAIMGRGDDLGC